MITGYLEDDMHTVGANFEDVLFLAPMNAGVHPVSIIAQPSL